MIKKYSPNTMNEIKVLQIIQFYLNYSYYVDKVKSVVRKVLIDHLKEYNNNAVRNDIRVIKIDEDFNIEYIYTDYSIKGYSTKYDCPYNVNPIYKQIITQKMFDELAKEFNRFENDYNFNYFMNEWKDRWKEKSEKLKVLFEWEK
jgi:hypothetical protein